MDRLGSVNLRKDHVNKSARQLIDNKKQNGRVLKLSLGQVKLELRGETKKCATDVCRGYSKPKSSILLLEILRQFKFLPSDNK